MVVVVVVVDRWRVREELLVGDAGGEGGMDGGAGGQVCCRCGIGEIERERAESTGDDADDDGIKTTQPAGTIKGKERNGVW